jgi:hypothetical protein
MCDERERLIGFVYDECDLEERREIARHLEECGDCRIEIRALRGVRQDLLAWEVEGEPAVWRPFVAPASVPWYRQVPGWALAAAATLLFAVSAAGGVVTHAMLTPAPTTATIAVAPPVTPDFVDIEQRLLMRMRGELAAQAAPASTVSMPAAWVMPAHFVLNVNQLVTASEDRSRQNLLDALREWANTTNNQNQELRALQRKVAELELALEQQVGGR